MTFTIQQLAVAYRKAKVDLYFSVDSREEDLLDYEENLERRLGRLLALLNSDDSSWVDAPSFVGTYSLVPKSLRSAPGVESESIALWSDPGKQFHAEASRLKPDATFRMISRCSIDMHVVSSLWLMTAGAELDGALSHRAMGNRLRRRLDGSFNDMAAGSFKPYLEPFRRWREDGLKAIDVALDEDKRILAVTGDATSYYHVLDPRFLVTKKFLSVVLPSGFDTSSSRINAIFVRALRSWSSRVAEDMGDVSRVGLPVGLPASAVVANLALIEFDQFVQRELTPLYYARYVDDFFLVLEDSHAFESPRDLWTWVSSLAPDDLRLTSTNTGLSFSPKYLGQSRVRFDNRKNRIFRLEGRTGKSLISSLRRTIAEQGSEWRALPTLPTTNVEIGTRMVIAMQADGDPADNLRKADKVSARRAKFALQLRDFEAFQRDLDPADWTTYRSAFFESVCDHVLTPYGLFELWTYLARLLRLSLVCKDFDMFSRMVARLDEVIQDLNRSANLSVAGVKTSRIDQISVWRGQLCDVVKMSLAATGIAGATVTEISTLRRALSCLEPDLVDWFGITDLDDLNRRLFVRDLAHTPARFAVLPTELAPRTGPDLAGTKYDSAMVEALPPAVRVGMVALAEIFPHDRFGSIAPALAFPTRPFNLVEMFVSADPFASAIRTKVEASMQRVADATLALRGFSIHADLPSVIDDGQGGQYVSISDADQRPPGKRRIAIGSLETRDAQAKRAAMGTPDLGLARYRRVASLVNELISRPGQTDYLLLPELSLPSRWFLRIAQKLGAQGINLVVGMEYSRRGATVTNQVWASLRHRHFGFPSLLVYRQDKQRPASGEGPLLADLAGLSLVPQNKWATPPVLSHGGFFFATVVCSELTNIAYRASLRGRIDALFVPEWNRDIHTFEALVESAALDIHAYVVQANNRKYGDSRIRVPAVNEWERDLIRHRGGLFDYAVIGEIDFDRLREHQSVDRVSKPRFKPVPDGFTVSSQRFHLPPKER